MPREWTDDDVLEEINKAVQIVREDRMDKLLRSRLSPPKPENDPTDPPETDPTRKPPPKKDKPETPPVRKSLWWGEPAEDDAPKDDDK